MRIILFLLFISTGLQAQYAFRNPDGLTILAPPPSFGVTTVYDYVITDGQTQWSVNSYNGFGLGEVAEPNVELKNKS